MIYEFERILKNNDLTDTSPELTKHIRDQIAKFRGIQDLLKKEEDPDEQQKLKKQLTGKNDHICELFEDYYELIDEAAEKKKEELKARAKAVGLDENATEQQIIKKENQMKQQKERAKALGLREDATIEEIEAAEIKKRKEKQEKLALARRAKKAGLPENATLKQIEEAEALADETKKWGDRAEAVGLPRDASEAAILEQEKKIKDKKEARKKDIEELGLPDDATDQDIANAKKKKADEGEEARKKQEKEAELNKLGSDERALKILYDRGKTQVSLDDLRAEKFNVDGFLSPLGPNGCNIGRYKLYRDDPLAKTLKLTKR